MSWYYEVDRQQRGPVSDEEFAGLVAAGTVHAATLVWKEGWPEWRAYGSAAGAVAGDDADTAVCAVSGQRRPKRDMLEFEGRWVSVEHKAEFFQRLREGVNQPRDVVYASFWRRFGAKFVDGCLLWLIALVPQGLLSLVFFGSVNYFSPNRGALSGPGSTMSLILYQVATQALGIGLGLSYALYFIRKQDATPGKKMLGLKLLRADGSKLSKGRIVARHFSEWISGIILGIGYLMAAFDKEERRALHDRMCDTRVIDVRGQ